MKKITLFLFALVLSLGYTIAQNADNKWGIGVGPGLEYNIETEATGILADFYVSRYLSPRFDLMLDNRWSFNDAGTDVVASLLNLRIKLYNDDMAIQPYLFGGPGYMWDNDESDFTFDYGAGLKFPVGEKTSLFVSGSYVNSIKGYHSDDPNNAYGWTDEHFQVTSVLEFALGKAKDEDGDGVSDRKDECPGTPAGVQVDEKGCPIDTDGDGVPDYKDDCPTEAGPASLNGCPDKDGDGVADKDDDCPDTPGLAKFNGCPDTDGDGVPDPKDKCPDTPKGCPVDADGCPLDSDGDGVIDCEDDCPSQVGPASNNGCPDWSEISIPTIYFDFDKSTLRPEAKVELDKLADQLNAAKEYDIVIGGHTDNIGTESYNMGLSERRAQAVVKYLLQKGVNNAYVGSNNYGETKPAVPNTTLDNKRKNRRAEFEVAKIRK
ncbi:Thrombospondin type 3 repeat-containing protein [Draconibacterium orientale]|uniref:Cell envelope biogenesis protein OmpA n=1 Tax=Draconibacterium orientale TaxID=1168034 RepID=X5DCR2_9BACT|nr:OmpA family protein [Draconibacterium orientale]AHW58739.1 cell envelope biogenesis protein OmpA [Draconibacterium orientale]SEU09567.1 Thrombospondin type 3 repeat-containing protein [Draconibacterium orientale]